MLAILVVRDGASWLRGCLNALSGQSHPRLAVVAVDNASTDGSFDLLSSALTEERIIRLNEPVGFPSAVGRAMELPIAEKADYFLLLHDDAELAPDAISLLVECATRIPRTGVVGPKVLDAERPGLIREVGLQTDRFGYPASAIEEDEIDHGQYDTIREVLFVSTTAMLISREAWRRAGPFDDRLATGHGALDFCWRTRLAGMRVVVDPRARVRHHAVSERGLRPGASGARARYLAERAGLLSLLKNYRLRSLLWIVPTYMVQGAAKLVAFLVTRRFSAAWQLVRAWGWNLLNLPGTIRRRMRSEHRAPERAVVRFMAPAGARLRRLGLQASSALMSGGTRTQVADDDERSALVVRVSSMVLRHPVALGWTLALVLTLLSFRHVLFGPELAGGALPVFPASSAAFFRELVAPWHWTGFGSAAPASPALLPLGAASFLTLGDPGLLARLLVAGTPLMAGVACYRAALRMTQERLSAVAAAACYGVSAVALWSSSEGRLPAMALIIALPPLSVRLWETFERRDRRGWGPVIGTGAGIAMAGSFLPSIWVPLVLVTFLGVASAPRIRDALGGVAAAVGSFVVAVLLVMPFAIRVLSAGDSSELAGTGAWSSILRLSPGGAPGAAWPALFLPVAAVLALGMSQDARRAWRAAVLVALALPLAWLAAAGKLPEALGGSVAFLGVAAFGCASLVGLGIRGVAPGVSRETFGHRQLAFGALVTVVAVGLGLQGMHALGAGWAVGTDRISPAWTVVSTSDAGRPFRVLWLGSGGSRPLPAPGGAPDGELSNGGTSIRYAVTGREGRTATELGVPADGPGHRRLGDVVAWILSGDTHHGGALLASLGIRYVVAGTDDLPAEMSARLGEQLDIDLVQRAGGLRAWRTAGWLPRAWLARTDPLTARSDHPEGVATVLRASEALAARGPLAWSGSSPEGGVAGLSAAYHTGWTARIDGREASPFRALGWAPAFDVPRGAQQVEVRFDGGLRRLLELGYLLIVWAAALWLSRRPDAS